MAEIKRVTLHPLYDDGTINKNVNIYPKTLIDGIVDREGNPIDIPALIDQEKERAETVEQELHNKINDEKTRAQTVEESLNTKIHQEVEERQLADIDLNNRIEYINTNYYNKSETDNLLLQKEDLQNKVNVISDQCTNTEYPSALAVKDYVALTEKYVDNALLSKADLVNGMVPSTQLPSYVDDVIEFNKEVDGLYWYKDAVSSSVAIGKMVFNNATASKLDGGTSSPYYRKFLRKISEPDAAWESSPESHKEDYYGCMEVVAPENGKIYVCLSNEVSYRWSGTNIVKIPKSIALGETSSTAYAGNKGKANADEIASLKEKTFNVINASDIVNNTLTQEQYDLITNGKPTLIKGAFLLGYNNFVLFPPLERSIDFIFEAHYTTAYPAFVLGLVSLNKTTKVISLNTNKFYRGDQFDSISASKFNSKDVPAYPSSTGTFSFKYANGALTWTKEWYGTQAEYDALGTYDDNTIYNITEE